MRPLLKEKPRSLQLWSSYTDRRIAGGGRQALPELLVLQQQLGHEAFQSGDTLRLLFGQGGGMGG